MWLSQHVGTLGSITLQFLLTLALVAVFYLHGESLARQARRLARRVGGTRAEEGAVLAGQTMRVIAAGGGGLGLLPTGFGGLGLCVAGPPPARGVTFLLFL